MKTAYEGKAWIATPFYNMQAWSPYTASLAATVQTLCGLGINYVYAPMHGDSYVHRARNTICADFMADKEATDLFFIDSDESWEPLDFCRILLSPHKVIGGMYRMKNQWESFGGVLRLEGNNPIGIKIPGEEAAILECEFIPAGFLRIKREALEQFAAHYPDLHYHDESAQGERGREYVSYFDTRINGRFEGEDYTFCKRWRDMGGKIYCDPRAKITHYGYKGWEGNLDADLKKNIQCATPSA